MKIKGYDKLIRGLQKLGAKGHDVVEQATAKAAANIELKAKQYAPVNKNPNITGGDLRQSIKALPLGDLTYLIVATQKYAPYQEYGTGGLVTVDPEMYENAIQFKGKGIRQVNIPPQPFLYPAFVEGRDFYIKELKTQLDKLTNGI